MGESRIMNEISRIRQALLDPATNDKDYCNLYAAQQSLAWAIGSGGAASPFDTIMSGKVQPLVKDTLAG